MLIEFVECKVLKVINYLRKCEASSYDLRVFGKRSVYVIGRLYTIKDET